MALMNFKTFFAKDASPPDDSAAVRMSSSGQLSVDLADLVETKQFKKNLEVTKKIAALAAES